MRAVLKFIKLLVVFILLFPMIVFAQSKQTNNWNFGHHAGLNFSSGAAVSFNGTAFGLTSLTIPVIGKIFTSQNEGTASISDPTTGNLLFYTNGIKSYCSDHSQMPNGDGLFGGASSTQSALIVPDPGSTNRFYLFTTPENGGALHCLSYSVVDMTLNGGLGDIVLATKNTKLLDSSATNGSIKEQLTGIYHCNGRDVWVLVRPHNSGKFFAFLITPAGISAPIISFVGAIGSGYYGQMRISPNGRKIATRVGLGVQLFDFNNETGTVCNPVNVLPGTLAGAYGICFSPDNKLLYVDASTNLFQIDISSNPQIPVLTYSSFSGTGQLQIGPDGKIYQASYPGTTQWQSDSITVINNPNVIGAGCNLQRNVIGLDTNASCFGLPGFLENWLLAPNYIHPPFLLTAAFSNNTVCEGDTTFFNNSTVVPANHEGCPAYSWNFGDPNSGLANTSTLHSPYHIFTAAGNYQVSLVVYQNCQYDTLIQTVTVFGNTINSLSNDTTLCQGTTTTLSVSGGNAYAWSPAAGLSNATINNPLFTANNSTTYTVTVTNTCGSYIDTVRIDVIPSPSISVAGNTTICNGDNIQLTASGALAYSWSPATGLGTTTGAVINASPIISTTYTVLGTGSNNCVSSGAIMVTVIDKPIAAAGNDVEICVNETANLIATGGSYYVWSNGASSAGINVSPVVTSSYVVTAYTHSVCLASTDTINVIVNPLPVINLSGNVSIALGDNAQLTSVGGIGYSWSPSSSLSCSNCPNPVASPVNSTMYYLTIIDTNGCTSSESVFVEVITGDLYVPNVFSPNGDGVNDVFKLLSSTQSTKKVFLSIFNRWGELVFETNDITVGWDGTYRGEKPQTDVYTYVIYITLLNDVQEVKKGNITLLR